MPALASSGIATRFHRRIFVLAVLAALFALMVVAGPPQSAYAGQAASGELFFYPCTSCHPVAEGASAKLPNDFEGHGIILQGHDKLGTAETACLACHDDPAKDPAKLRLADGSLIDIKGDVAKVCFRCHSDKYNDWQLGVHGKDKPKCTSAGCHDPHTPGFIYAEPLRPFVATGFQFQAVGERAVFSPLAPPAVDPPVETPQWFAAMALVGVVAVGGLLGSLFTGRSKR